VRNGRSLADAFRTHALFPPLFPALAATGEATGSLDTSLARLAESIERSDALRARIRAALLYPALLGVAAIFGVTVILLVVVPRFAVLLQQAGGKLPFSTQLLMGVSALVTRGWPVWILLGLTAAVGWRRWLSLKGNALRFHAWRLRLPMVGGLERSMAAARYTRTLSLALPSGVDLLLAMRLARGAVSNRLIEQQLGEAEGRVRNGGSVAQSIGGTLPPLAIQLLDAGEASGALAELSARAADAFDGETERALAQAVTLIEPLLILGFGGVIGFVALGLLQAIYGINASTL
jgi:type II secretory pathway component PulF